MKKLLELGRVFFLFSLSLLNWGHSILNGLMAAVAMGVSQQLEFYTGSLKYVNSCWDRDILEHVNKTLAKESITSGSMLPQKK